MIWSLVLQLSTIGMSDAAEPESSHMLAARTFAVPPTGIVSHEVRYDPLLRQIYALQFFTAAETAGDGLCRRRSYYASHSQIGSGAARTIEQWQLALAADCRAVPQAQFAWVQPVDAIGDAAIMLRWLADRQRRGRATGVACLPSDFKPDPCADGAAATLRALPLERIYIINRGAHPGEWNLSVMPRGPGQLFYDVRLARDSHGGPTVTIQWAAPAPF